MSIPDIAASDFRYMTAGFALIVAAVMWRWLHSVVWVIVAIGVTVTVMQCVVRPELFPDHHRPPPITSTR